MTSDLCNPFYAFYSTHALIPLLQVFRPKLVNEKFVQDLGQLMSHLKSIDTGATQIQAATGEFLQMSVYPFFSFIACYQ